ncbi:unnamed protein product [Blepharisma stoltei]|uniref:t-SNARE coiled-coil homology domain-containing protein n=1 Tax=Blepharisma stoltei TaxID=1481888 RepID=A0AAU9J0X7_9CILI|nr:unnamed protein product [Blepharisma stoltei]
MLDRLQDFKNFRDNSNAEIPLIPKQEDEGATGPFMLHIRKAQESIDRVRVNNNNIRQLREELNRSVRTEQEIEINNRLKENLRESNKELNAVRDVIEGLSKEIDEVRSQNDIESRMKITMHATLARQFQDALAETEKTEAAFWQAARNKTSNQLRMVDQNIDDATIERCLEDPAQAQMIVNKQMMGAHHEIISMVHNIEDRLEDIKMLENNVNIMHRMFLDMAALVHSQGEILNSIETHVEKATDFVKKAEKNLTEAKRHQEKTRWRKCCLLVIALVILIIVVVPATTATKL